MLFPRRRLLVAVAVVLLLGDLGHGLYYLWANHLPDGVPATGDLALIVFEAGGPTAAVLLLVALLRVEASATRRARESASAAFRHLSDAIESIDEGFALYDPSDRLVVCNARYRDLYALSGPVEPGVRFEDLVRRGAERGQYADCDPANPEPWVAERLRLHRDPVEPIEQRLADGRWLKILERRTSDGGRAGIRTDITELKQREQELAYNSALLEATFAAMMQGVTVWDAAGRLLTHNRRFVEILELPPDLLAPGLPMRDYVRFLVERGEFGEAGAADMAEVVDQRVSFLETLAAFGRRAERVRPNGQVLEIVGAPLADGSTLVVLNDISAFRRVEDELRTSEERLRKLADAATDTILVHDHGRIVDANRAAAALTGYTVGELVGRPILDVVAPEDREKAARRIEERDESPFEITCIRDDGRRYIVEGETRYVSDRGRWLALVSVHDITAHRRAEAQLRLAKEQAELANQAKSEFLRMISHEIRTPLNGVLGTIGLLLDGELSDVQRIFARTARESGEALLTILNDILDLSKMEAGKLALETHAFDLVDVVESVVDLLAARATAKGVALASSVPAGLPAVLRGDAGRLRQVLLNLAGNAVKFTDTGSVAVTVSLTEAEAEAEAEDEDGRAWLYFEVVDTGVGIPAEAHATLFDEFTQVDPNLSRRHGGTGLGLAICKRLVEAMDGAIGFESTPGQGSLFWFTVPLEVQSAPAYGEPLAGRRVLLVDGNPLERRVLAAQIRSWGALVREAEDVAAALDTCRHGAFDVALLDGMTVGLDETVLRRLVEDLRADGVARVALLTVLGHSLDVARLDVDAAVVKPAHQARLLAAMGGLATAAEPPRPAAATAPHPAGRRLLLVEDSPTNQMVATAFLKAAGYQVDVAANGLEAVEAARTLPYDLVLMDLAMPEMDGLSATRALRALPPPAGTMPIIAMTADAMEDDRRRCLAAGMNDHVAKPIDRTHLLETVLRWLPDVPAVPGVPPPAVAAPAVGRNTAPSDVGGADVGGPDAAALDGAVLDQLAEDLDAELLSDVIRQFVEETLARAARIAGTDADLGTLAREAHTLKSTAGTFGATLLSAAARELERACRAGAVDEADALRRRIPALVREAAEAYRGRGLLG